ncbi:MAG: hypothetical protein SGARI_005393, partial [Bacillariaceae sp.]
EHEIRFVRGSEPVAIPAAAVVWFKPNKEDSGRFDARVCDARKLSRLPIRVPSVQRLLLQDHLASNYEIAFKNVQVDGEGEKKQKDE